MCYIRIVDENDQVHSRFLIRKARMAPMKAIFRPWLELMAAALTVKLNKMMKQKLNESNYESFF